MRRRSALNRAAYSLIPTRPAAPKSGSFRELMQCLKSRKKKIGSAAHPHERCWTFDVEIDRSVLYRDALSVADMADGIRSGVQTVEAGVVEP